MDPKEKSLHQYVKFGELAAVKDMVLKNIDAFQTDYSKNTTLHIASMFNRREVAEYLLEIGLNLNAVNNSGETALHVAAAANAIDTFKLLLENKADVNVKKNSGNAVIHDVVENNSEALLKLLVDHKVDLNIVNQNGNSPLHVAIIRSSLDCVKILLNTNVKKNQTNNYGWTELMVAVSETETSLNEKGRKIIELLINDERIDINAISRNEWGYSCLHCAAYHGNVFPVEKLLEKEVKLNEVPDSFGNYPLHVASAKNRKEIIEFLMKKIPSLDLNIRGFQGWTPLHFAVHNNCYSTVELLVSNNASCNATDVYGNTPLHFLALKYLNCGVEDKRLKCYEIEFEVNKCTPIREIRQYLSGMFKMCCFYEAAIMYLVKKGNADLYMKNDGGKSALDLIKENKMNHYFYFSLKTYLKTKK